LQSSGTTLIDRERPAPHEFSRHTRMRLQRIRLAPRLRNVLRREHGLMTTQSQPSPKPSSSIVCHVPQRGVGVRVESAQQEVSSPISVMARECAGPRGVIRPQHSCGRAELPAAAGARRRERTRLCSARTYRHYPSPPLPPPSVPACTRLSGGAVRCVGALPNTANTVSAKHTPFWRQAVVTEKLRNFSPNGTAHDAPLSEEPNVSAQNAGAAWQRLQRPWSGWVPAPG
jgi:hypothetical protein